MRKKRLLALVFGLLLSFSGYAQSDSEAQPESKGSFFLSGGIYNGFFSDDSPLLLFPNFEVRKLFSGMISGNYELPLGLGKTAFGLEAGFSSGSRFGGKGNVDFIPFDLNVSYVFPLAKNFYIGPKLKIGGLGLLSNDWNDVILMAGARLEAELRSTGFPFGLFVSGGIDIFPLAPQFATLPVIEAGIRFPRGKLKKSSSPASAKNKEPAEPGTGGVMVGTSATASAGSGTGQSVTGQGQGTGTGAGTGTTTGQGTGTTTAGSGTGQGATQGQGTGTTPSQGATGATGATQSQGSGTGAGTGTTGAGTGATQGAGTGTGAAGAGAASVGSGTGQGTGTTGAGAGATQSQGAGTGATGAGTGTTGAGTGATQSQGATAGAGAGGTQSQGATAGAGAGTGAAGAGTGATQSQGSGTGAGTGTAGAGTGATPSQGATAGAGAGTGTAIAGTTPSTGAGTGATGAGTGATQSQGATAGAGAGTGTAIAGTTPSQGASTGGAATATVGSGLPNVAQGQNRSIILENGKQGILNSIYFEPDTAVLIESYRPILESVGRQLAADPSLKLIIRAYAANFGTADGRYMVSVSRARFSRDFFTAQGISASRFNIEAYGADKTPVYATADWQSHRCVELILFRD